jgi:hypothetical protein
MMDDEDVDGDGCRARLSTLFVLAMTTETCACVRSAHVVFQYKYM